MSRQTWLDAVTVWPEWAFGILYLGKDVENRKGWHFSVLSGLVGKWLAIHGGKDIGGKPLRAGDRPTAHHAAAIREVIDAEKYLRRSGDDPPPRMLAPVSVRDVLREARGLVAVVKVGGLRIGAPRGWYAGSPAVGIEFAQMVRLSSPIPCDGRQMLWRLSHELVQKVQAVLPNDAPAELAQLLSEVKR